MGEEETRGGSGGGRPRGEEIAVVERTYCDDDDHPSIGLANISAETPGLEANREKIARAARRFKELGVEFAIFPEFCLTGYFWDDGPSCRRYMDEALIENQAEWIESELRPLFDDRFRGIVLNGLTANQAGDRYLNKTFVLSAEGDPLADDSSYAKVFLPGIEKTYCESGGEDRLVVEGGAARVGFTACYDYLFGELMREYAILDEVDALVQVAAWRSAAVREYPGMNVRTDQYYGELWDLAMAAGSAMNQVWTIACNAVGPHSITGEAFWGGSGVWAPSGIPLLEASHSNEELLVIHNLAVREGRETEVDDFDYAFDFRLVYHPTRTARSFTRSLDLS